MSRLPAHSIASHATLARHRQLDDLAAILARIEAGTRPALTGRICPTCSGLRTPGRAPCDVCHTLRRGAELAPLVEDVEWLLGTDTPERIAARLGYSIDSLVRRLQRNGRGDLADRLIGQQEVA